MALKMKDRIPDSKTFPINILSWIGRHEFTVLFVLALIFGGIWLTVELADEVTEGETQDIDETLLMALREGADTNNPIGPPWLESLMRDFTSLGGAGILAFIVLAITIFYLIQGQYKEMLFLLTAVMGAYLISYLMKDFFGRARPQFVASGTYFSFTSFPSGHALLATTTYLTLGSIVAELMSRNRLKAFVLLLAIFLALVVGFTRVYLGVHWPTDVLAGWVIGSVWAMICWLGLRLLRRRRIVTPT
jgi:undecaprenyl-diphosphatase